MSRAAAMAVACLNASLSASFEITQKLPTHISLISFRLGIESKALYLHELHHVWHGVLRVPLPIPCLSPC